MTAYLSASPLPSVRHRGLMLAIAVCGAYRSPLKSHSHEDLIA